MESIIILKDLMLTIFSSSGTLGENCRRFKDKLKHLLNILNR